jgi:hypothetical protein
MPTTQKVDKFKIVEDVTFSYSQGQTIFLTLIQTESKYLLEVTDTHKIIGRRLSLDKSFAFYAFDVFFKQLQRQSYFAVVELCLKNSFSYRTVRETVLAMRLYDQSFHFSTIEKIIKRFALDVKYIYEDESMMEINGKKLSIELSIPNKKNKFGYFKGIFGPGVAFRFYFYPNTI